MKPDDNMNDIGSGVLGGIAGSLAKEGTKWGLEEIKKLALQLKEGVDLKFVGKVDYEAFSRSAKTPEYKLIRKFVEDRKHRSIMLTGIRLRQLEQNEDFKKVEEIKNSIHEHSGRPGVHLAQFVQSGLFNRSWNVLFGEAATEEELKSELNRVINELDKYVDFIEARDIVKTQVQGIHTRIIANKTPLYMIGATGPGAVKKAKEIVEGLKNKKMSDYDFEEQETMRNVKYYAFIKRIEK